MQDKTYCLYNGNAKGISEWVSEMKKIYGEEATIEEVLNDFSLCGVRI
jgi:hypothetical protein